MKQNMARILTSVALALAVASCSDGELQFGEGPDRSIGAVAPTIISFKADPVEIQEGGSTTLSWKVLQAEKIMISGLGVTGKFKTNIPEIKEAEGKTIIEGISETTEFTLTAIGSGNAKPSEGDKPKPTKQAAEKPGDKPAALKPGELRKVATITVKVVPKSEVAVSLTADAESVGAGESTILRWSITPEDATITLTSNRGDDDMVFVYGPEDCEDADANALNDKPELDAIPAKGCALVYPESPSTTYTLKAVDKNGKEGMASKTIAVSGDAIDAEIMINGSSTDAQVKAGETVTVSWTVTPANAKVKITATGGVDSTCQEAFPNDVVSDQTSAQCVVNGETLFTITAQVGELKDEDSIRVLIERSTNVGLNFDTVPWAFAGETVSLKIMPADAAGIRGDTKVVVQGETREELSDIGVEGKMVRVVVPPTGVKVDVVANGATLASYTPVTLMATTMTPLSSDGPEVAVTRVAFDPNAQSRMLRGIQKKDVLAGDPAKVAPLRYYDNNAAMPPIDLASVIESIGLNNNAFFKAIGEFPVSALAVRPGKAAQMFAGTSGFVMYSEDSGATWKMLTAYLLKVSEASSNGAHASCGGKELKGITLADRGGKDPLVGVGQVCDIVVRQDGRLIIATDRGVRTIRNADTFISDWKQSPQIGRPEGGKKADDTGFKTYGHVVNDIEDVADQNMTFAATDRGVYVSRDGGETFEAFGSLGPTLAVVYDEQQVIAGLADGKIYMSGVGTASWVEKGNAGGKVLSLVADPYSPAIIAGTTNGAMISRDGGMTFAAIPGADGEVRSVALVAKGASVVGTASSMPVAYAIMIGSTKGTIAGGANATVYMRGPEPIPGVPPPPAGTPAALPAGEPANAPADESNIPQGEETAAADDEDATIE